jgi:hypothetical protein
VEVQEVRWEGGSTEPAGEYTFFYGERNKTHELGTSPPNERLISAVNRVEFEFVSDGMSYMPQQRIKLMM